MTLQQMFDLASRKSYFSRSDSEVWHALSNAQMTLYLKTLKERRAFFVVFDTTNLTLVGGTEEYALPAACGQILRLRERPDANSNWLLMDPADLLDPAALNGPYYDEWSISLDGPSSEFSYVGPYLDDAAAQTATQIQKIRVEPIPQAGVTRQTELVYVAKCVDVTGPSSPLIIPAEGHNAMLFAAVTQLLGDNGDDPTTAFNQQKQAEVYYLDWVRRRQFQTGVTHVEPYISDLD